MMIEVPLEDLKIFLAWADIAFDHLFQDDESTNRWVEYLNSRTPNEPLLVSESYGNLRRMVEAV